MPGQVKLTGTANIGNREDVAYQFVNRVMQFAAWPGTGTVASLIECNNPVVRPLPPPRSSVPRQRRSAENRAEAEAFHRNRTGSRLAHENACRRHRCARGHHWDRCPGCRWGALAVAERCARDQSSGRSQAASSATTMKTTTRISTTTKTVSAMTDHMVTRRTKRSKRPGGIAARRTGGYRAFSSPDAIAS